MFLYLSIFVKHCWFINRNGAIEIKSIIIAIIFYPFLVNATVDLR